MSMKYWGNCWKPTDNNVGYGIQIGTRPAQTAAGQADGSGMACLTSRHAGFEVNADTGSTNLSGDYYVSAIKGNFVVGTTSSNASIIGVLGALNFNTAGVTNGGHFAVRGHLDFWGSQTLGDGGSACWTGAVSAYVEVESTTTVSANHVLCGVEAYLVSGTITNSGTVAGVYVHANSAVWQYGMLIPAGSAGVGIQVGTSLSSVAQTGHHIGTADTARAISVFADDNNLQFTSDCRLAIFHAQSAAYAASCVRGQLRIVGAAITPNESKAWQGVSGVIEGSGTYTIGDGSNFTIVAALNGACSTSGTPTIAANAVLTGLHITGSSLPASPSGETVGVLFQASTQGYEHTFGFAGVGSTDGNGLSATGPAGAVTHKIAVWINGVGTKYIELKSIS